MFIVKKTCLLIILLLLIVPGTGISGDSTYILLKSVSGSGGVLFSHNEQNFHYATAGESIIGNVANENNLLRSGFWGYPLPGISGTEEHARAAVPDAFQLYQNYPNPFNPTTVIKYDLPKPTNVKLEIFNILGERILTLVNSELINAGYHQVVWNGRNQSGSRVSSGIYFYRLLVKSGADNKTPVQFIKKMIYLK